MNNGVAYVAAINTSALGGFATVDVSDPDNPTLISDSDVGVASSDALVSPAVYISVSDRSPTPSVSSTGCSTRSRCGPGGMPSM